MPPSRPAVKPQQARQVVSPDGDMAPRSAGMGPVDPSAIKDAMDLRVRPLLDLVDQIRALGIESHISIPQIAVMGDQSSGKSSVLEAISGLAFPRGTGLVTRCATQISMKNAPPGTAWSAQVKVSWEQEQPPEAGPVGSPGEIGAKIETVTNILTAKAGTTFSKDAIVIDVVSPDVPDLTIVDLPGIVRTVTEGQSRSVIEDVDNLIKSYLSQPRTIVLAVVPANVDIATVEIVERAQQYDPEGVRTIGVITKPDLVDAGGEAEVCYVLRNVRKPLKLGYIMVKNRSQKELSAGLSTADALGVEARFFERHPAFGLDSGISRGLFGIKNLTSRLTSILTTRIDAELPRMVAEVEAEIDKAAEELILMGRAAPQGDAQKVRELIAVSQKYAELLEAAIGGSYKKEPLETREDLRLYKQCKEAYYEFQQGLDSSKPAFESGEYRAEIQQKVRASWGRHLPGFLNKDVFGMFIQNAVSDWRRLSLVCLRKVFEICVATSDGLAEVAACKYSDVQAVMSCMSHQCIHELEEATRKHVLDALEREFDEPFTLNGDYMNIVAELRGAELRQRIVKFVQAMQRHGHMDTPITVTGTQLYQVLSPALVRGTDTGCNEALEALEMETYLRAYWTVASKRFADVIPQVIDTHLLSPLAKQVQRKFLEIISEPERIRELFKVPASVVTRRASLEEKLACLRGALELMRRTQQRQLV